MGRTGSVPGAGPDDGVTDVGAPARKGNGLEALGAEGFGLPGRTGRPLGEGPCGMTGRVPEEAGCGTPVSMDRMLTT